MKIHERARSGPGGAAIVCLPAGKFASRTASVDRELPDSAPKTGQSSPKRAGRRVSAAPERA